MPTRHVSLSTAHEVYQTQASSVRNMKRQEFGRNILPRLATLESECLLKPSVTLPGDKSISHRYAMLGGLAEGTTRLSNFSTGADPHSSLACMETLGAKVRKDGKTIEITGVAGAFRKPEHPLDCGNSGSTMRML